MFPLFYLLGIAFLIVPTARLPLIGLSPSDVFIFAALGWLVLESILERRTKRAVIPVHILWFPAMLILVGGLLASFQAVSPLRSVWTTVKVWFVVAPWVSMGIVMLQRGYLKPILYTLVFAGGFSATVGIIDQVSGSHLSPMFSQVDTNYWGRMTGTFGHPSTLGYFTCVVCPIAFGLLVDEWQHKRRALLCIALGLVNVLLLDAMFNSGSVTAWVGTLTAFTMIAVVWLLHAQVWMRWAAALLGVTVLLVGGAVILLDLVPANVQTVLDTNLLRATETTGPGRLGLLAAAFELIDHDPFIGAGMDQTGTGGLENDLVETGATIHNTIISGWLNGGLLTFVGLVLAYVIAGLTAIRGLDYGIVRRNWIVLTLSAASFAWMVFDQTQPQLSQRFTWLTVSLLFGMGFGFQWTSSSQPSSANSVPNASPLRFSVKQGKAGAGK